MTGFSNVTHQGWFARYCERREQNACPYPANSHSGREWLTGWFKAERGEHWNNLSRKKAKKEKVRV